MDNKCVLLDTNFLIQLLKKDDPLHSNVVGFFRIFLDKEFKLKFSTISIAEYCVRGQLDQLPLPNLEILPFNVLHGATAGEFTRMILENKGLMNAEERPSIKDDLKLLAQAQIENEITSFATSDQRLLRIITFLKQDDQLSDLEIINTVEPYSSILGVLPFKE